LETEDEAHALLRCEGDPELVTLRQIFLSDINARLPDVPTMTNLVALTRDRQIVRRLAKYTFDVFEKFQSVDTYIPPPNLYLDEDEPVVVPPDGNNVDWDSDRDGDDSDTDD
jgi:hypothetical protein